ncbi:RNA polymerase sigma factor [Thermovenabulum gondwanense]|uniref:ECF RNA polymerase sigma factor SigE n=1 Tax=Thermovenabulum gondwanense TaxID=520767 RepID=A0A162MYP9_9FIRM|nr:RNA polymerase sigma factor [Thermovenabulum gondwanense]KYO68565.1 ECF RNA polymerase sigma factor SigE [Thermovenabulum gondwanense]
MENFDLFESLYRSYFSKAYRAAFLVAQDENIAHDSVQEAFLAACEILKKSPINLSRFQALVCAIATKKAINFIRNKSKYVLIDESFMDTIVSLNTNLEVSPDTITDAENRMDLDYALKQLNPIYRQILVLKYYNDLSENEISKYLGVPVGTVKSRLYRARMFLRNFFREQNEGAGCDEKG